MVKLAVFVRIDVVNGRILVSNLRWTYFNKLKSRNLSD